jgi:hypothetical protein
MLSHKGIAERLVSYYEHLDTETKVKGHWTFEADTAKWWLKLINQDTPDFDEVNRLMDVLNNHELGSAWYEMRLYARAWQHRLFKHP